MVKLRAFCTETKSAFGLLQRAEIEGVLVPRDSR